MATIGEVLEAKGIVIKPVQFDAGVAQKKAQRIQRKRVENRRRNRRTAAGTKTEVMSIAKELAGSKGFIKATLRGQERVLREIIQDHIISTLGKNYKFYKRNWWKIMYEATRLVASA